MSKPTKDFWTQFANAIRKEGERHPPGDGWKKLDELVKIIGGHRTNVGHRLMKGVKMGLIERFIGLTLQNGRLRTTSWYREKVGR